MSENYSIGLIGDYDASVPAHQAIPLALELAAKDLGIAMGYEWIPTDEIHNVEQLHPYAGLWCVPASPYRSMDGALLAIRYAREAGRPFLGTCGGFQHAIIEYARNVLGWHDAEHAETSPDAERAVITPLACALVEATDSVYLRAETLLAEAYGQAEIREGYRCRYGLSPAMQAELGTGLLRISAEDAAGDVRAVELAGHPFFVATLFQPERAALKGQLPPLVRAFAQAVAQSL